MLSAFHLFFYWCAGSLGVAFAAAPLLIGPKIFNAEVDTARREAALHGDSSGGGQLETAAWLSALGVLESEAGRPHAARDAWRRLQALCEEWQGLHFKQFSGKDVGRAAALCVQAAAEITAQDSFPMHWRTGKRIPADILAFQTAEMEESERLSLTGRIRSSLSPAYGQDFRAALVALRILERLAPQTPGTSYWIGKALERQGNTPMAEEAFVQSLTATPPDPRSEARGRRLMLGDSDEPTYGWTPFVFASPARGFGGGVLLWDDRIADTRRGFRLEGHIGTRPTFGGAFAYREAATTAPLVLHLSVRGGKREWDFFGFGMTAAAPAAFTASQVALEAALQSPAWRGLSLTVGGVLRKVDATAAPAALVLDGNKGLFHVLEWDAMDRRNDPRRGARLSWRQEWLWRDGTAQTFSRAIVEAKFLWPLAVRHRLALNAAFGGVSGAAPFNATFDPAVFGAPGIREFRYQDATAASVWVQYRYRLLNWLGVGVFGTGAAVDPLVSALAGNVRLGGGLEINFQLARDPQFTPRWEFGVFNGEWIVQGGFRAAI